METDQLENVLIRHETNGTVIFSKPMECYLIPRDNSSEEQLKLALEYKRRGESMQGLDIEFLKNLETIGFNGRVRELTSNGQSGLMAPLEIYFDFTNKCNLRCGHCYNKNHLGNSTVPPEKVRSLIEEMYQMGVMRLHLAGGEPTLEREGLLNYLGTARRFGLVTSMSSNGTKLDEDLCERIMENDLYAFTFSVDGPDEQRNSFIRGPGNFIKTLNAITIAKGVKQRLGVRTRICMKSVCSPSTPHDTIEDMVILGEQLGLDEIKFYSPERSLHHEIGYYGKTVNEYYEMIKFMELMKNKYKGRVKVSPVINPVIGGCLIGLPFVKGCIGANELLTINPDGSITPCLMMKRTLGNVYETGLREFWDSSQEIRDYRVETQSPDCDACSSYESCRGGCQVRKIVEHGKLKGIDPLCPIKYSPPSELKIVPTRRDLKFFRGVFNAHSL